ncbi:hypothetical protein FRC00_005668 [Tulasnella sp. 408]|nr:hypothetical protein FRC00_005668 [Tulasnella sp. 408]
MVAASANPVLGSPFAPIPSTLTSPVYKRGFWRTSNASSSSESETGITSEMDVVIPPVCPQDDLTDGAVEGESDAILNVNWTDPRHKRLRWSAETIVRSVDGLIWLGEGREKCVGVIPPLMNKLEMWMAEKQREEELERQRMERLARMSRLYLQSPAVAHRSRAPRSACKAKPTRPLLQVAPGYTILVCDTNILLGSLPMVSNLVASQRWTVVVPLAVVTELDGLQNQPTDLGHAATEAFNYLITAVQTQSTSLKVEATTLGEGERNMDDLIVRSALWQLDRFVDRTGLLIASRNAVKRTDKTSNFVLRVKDRARQLDEKAMAAIFSSAK